MIMRVRRQMIVRMMMQVRVLLKTRIVIAAGHCLPPDRLRQV
jgi:hypothetical protein